MAANRELKYLDCDVLITKCCDKLVALPKTYLSAVKDFDEIVENLNLQAQEEKLINLS